MLPSEGLSELWRVCKLMLVVRLFLGMVSTFKTGKERCCINFKGVLEISHSAEAPT